MAFSINQVFLVGNVTQEPELRYTPSGKPVLTFSMATNRRVKKNDEWTDVANFHKIVVWGSISEWLATNLVKGGKITVQGRIDTRQYEDKNGVKKYITEIVAENVIPGSSMAKKANKPEEQKDITEDLPEETTSTGELAEEIPF